MFMHRCSKSLPFFWENRKLHWLSWLFTPANKAEILPLEEVAMAVEITGNKGPMQHFNAITNQGFKGLGILVLEELILI